MSKSTAEIVREYGPFPGADSVDGVTYDGQQRLVCCRRQAERLRSGEREDAALDRCRRACRNGLRRPAPVSDRRGSHPEDRSEDRPCARHDPGARRRRRLGAHVGRGDALGRAVSGPEDPSESIPRPATILRTIESNRFVTGVTWVDGELWHGTWEGDESDLRRIDPQTGEVLEQLEMPPGVGVSGLESDGGDQFFCGGGNSGKVQAPSADPSAAPARAAAPR